MVYFPSQIIWRLVSSFSSLIYFLGDCSIFSLNKICREERGRENFWQISAMVMGIVNGLINISQNFFQKLILVMLPCLRCRPFVLFADKYGLQETDNGFHIKNNAEKNHYQGGSIMPNIVLTRINNRLVHGQVATQWCGSIGANLILVANDEVAGNKLRQGLMDMAALSYVLLDTGEDHFYHS